MPELSPAMLGFIRTAYGLLMLLSLVWIVPHRRRFLLTEKWGGYAESRPDTEILHNPRVMPVVLAVWSVAAIALATGRAVLPAALVNVALCRYYFVAMRWKGVLRGLGAPGFMAYWLGAAILLLEFASRMAPAATPWVLLTIQADFALIMFSAGIYKWSAGYARNEGMDYGMANPQWSYWWRFFRRVPPRHIVFRFLNQMAWSTEVVAAALMLVPGTRAIGGLIISLSFLLVWTQIRLAWLAEMVMVCGLLFVPAGHVIDRWIAALNLAAPAAPPSIPIPAIAVIVPCLIYLVLTPLAHAGLFYNFYGHRRLPAALQSALEWYTNLFGLIIWRVFSVDHLDFFIKIYRRTADGAREFLSPYGVRKPLRYAHVGESITVCTLFTTLRYYPSNGPLFVDRLRRYARTIACSETERLEFEYVSIQKRDDGFLFVPTRRFLVEPRSGPIEEQVIDSSVDPRSRRTWSPVREASRPGSYAPIAGSSTAAGD